MLMTLGTEQGVIDLCKNTDTNLINRTLIKARAILTKRLAGRGHSTPTSDVVLDIAVEAIAAQLIGIGPGAVDPRTGFKVDGFERKDGSVSQLDEWQALADGCIDEYVDSEEAATSPLPTMSIVGRRGRRIGEYEEMEEDEEAEY